MPNVFAYFDASEHAEPSQAALLRVWVRSWRKRGWTPRVLTVRNAAKHRDYNKFKGDPCELSRLAQESVRASWLCNLQAINFSFTPSQFRKTGPPKAPRFLSAGWKTAPVVFFSNIHDMTVIENCGRSL